MEIRAVQDAANLERVRELLLEYAAGLEVDLSQQHFDDELARLPGEYGPPGGAILLAWDGDRIAGCVALRPSAAGICEMKRMYVRPEFRGRQLGRQLAAEIITTARRLGYAAMRLDTLATMPAANRLYESLGFTDCEPYGHHPFPGTRYMQRSLA